MLLAYFSGASSSKDAIIPFIVDSRNFPCDYHHSIRKMNAFELYSIDKPDLKPHDKINEDDLKIVGLKLQQKFNKPLIITIKVLF